METSRKELSDIGIYFDWSGDELHKNVALVIGPEETPYDGGFYFFELEFPNDYPLQPPRVTFRTGDGRVRFNPNLYVEGKVCLSILGTWAGPGWTTACNWQSVLLSIQSLLSAHPIQNEPGHENERGSKDELYSEIIRYENVAVAVMQMLRRTPSNFQSFRPEMRRIFLERFGRHLETLNSFKPKDGNSAKSPIWGFQTKFRIKESIKELTELRDSLLLEAPEGGSDPSVSSGLAVGEALASTEAEAAAEPPCKRARRN